MTNPLAVYRAVGDWQPLGRLSLGEHTTGRATLGYASFVVLLRENARPPSQSLAARRLVVYDAELIHLQ